MWSHIAPFAIYLALICAMSVIFAALCAWYYNRKDERESRRILRERLEELQNGYLR